MQDGHAADAVSESLSLFLHQKMFMSELFQCNISECIRQTFAKADEEILLGFLDEIDPLSIISRSQKSMSPWKTLESPGSTACCVLIQECQQSPKYHIFWCGDTRAVLCRNGEAIQLSDDHRVTNKKEQNRISKRFAPSLHGSRVETRVTVHARTQVTRRAFPSSKSNTGARKIRFKHACQKMV